MKRVLIITVLIFFIGLIALSINLPMTDDQITGTYVNTNYEKEICCLEAPHVADTMVLKSDGTFTSGFYGDGTYKISKGVLETKINWTYDYEMGKAGYSTYFTNEINDTPKIMLNYDLNHYYKKIE